MELARPRLVEGQSLHEDLPGTASPTSLSNLLAQLQSGHLWQRSHDSLKYDSMKSRALEVSSKCAGCVSAGMISSGTSKLRTAAMRMPKRARVLITCNSSLSFLASRLSHADWSSTLRISKSASLSLSSVYTKDRENSSLQSAQRRREIRELSSINACISSAVV